jgi:hypothetical protein
MPKPGIRRLRGKERASKFQAGPTRCGNEFDFGKSSGFQNDGLLDSESRVRTIAKSEWREVLGD